jgi:hypothetical protein
MLMIGMHNSAARIAMRGAAGNFAFFPNLMPGLPPRFYDVPHLEALGGRIRAAVNRPKQNRTEQCQISNARFRRTASNRPR